jgi:hypothetical protein
MIRAKVTRLLTRAGFAPAGKRSWLKEAYSYVTSIRNSADNFCRVAGDGTAGFGVEPGGVS